MAKLPHHACPCPLHVHTEEPTHTQFYEPRQQRPVGPGSPATCLGSFPITVAQKQETPPPFPPTLLSACKSKSQKERPKVFSGLQECCPIQMQQSAAVSPAPCLGPVPGLRGLHTAPAQACLRRHSCPVPAALITRHSGPQQPILNVVTLKSIFPTSPSLLQNCLLPNSQHRGEGKHASSSQ